MSTIDIGVDTFGDVTGDGGGRLLPQARVLRDVVARTTRIRLGTAVTVLSTDDPVRVYDPRRRLRGPGRGDPRSGIVHRIVPVVGYSLDDYDTIFEEKLAVFAALRDADRTGGSAWWKGTVRPSLDGVRVYPRVERPPLSTWVGVGGSPESVVRAARYRFPLTLAIIGGDPRRFAPYVELYYRALAHLGAESLAVGVHSPGHIADTDEQAREELWPHYEVMRNRIGGERGWPPTNRAEFERERPLRGRSTSARPRPSPARSPRPSARSARRAFDLK